MSFSGISRMILEMLFRDLYTVGRAQGRLAEWVKMKKAVFGIQGLAVNLPIFSVQLVPR
jgi:hypothetical protein